MKYVFFSLILIISIVNGVCGQCDDTPGNVKIRSIYGLQGREVSCSWAQDGETKMKCAYDEISNHCKKTCGICKESATRLVTTDASRALVTSTCLDTDSVFQLNLVGFVTCTSGWNVSNDVKCAYSDFAIQCPRLCGSCCDDFSTTERFLITSVTVSKPYSKLCEWAGKRDVKNRCAIED